MLCGSPVLISWSQTSQWSHGPKLKRTKHQCLVKGMPGRPELIITREQLEYLWGMHFSWTQISGLLGVSRMTVYRRRRGFGVEELSHPGRDVSTGSFISYFSEWVKKCGHWPTTCNGVCYSQTKGTWCYPCNWPIEHCAQMEGDSYWSTSLCCSWSQLLCHVGECCMRWVSVMVFSMWNR